MTYESHDLALCAINDGDGSQCGRSYNERCKTTGYRASLRAATWVDIARRTADWHDLHDDSGKTFTAGDILLAALELEEYYSEHAKELA